MIILQNLKSAFMSVPYTNSGAVRKVIRKNMGPNISFYCDSIKTHGGTREVSNEIGPNKVTAHYLVCHPYDYIAHDYSFLKEIDIKDAAKFNSREYTRVLKFKLMNPMFDVFLNTFYELDNPLPKSIFGQYKINTKNVITIGHKVEDTPQSIASILSLITKTNWGPSLFENIPKKNPPNQLWSEGFKLKVYRKYCSDFIDYGYDR